MWLTKEQIEFASKKDAIKCSILHWQQIRAASPEKLKLARLHGDVTLGGSHCALCLRFGTCSNGFGECPLQDDTVKICCKEYRMLKKNEENRKKFLYWVDKLIKKLESLI